MKPSSIILLLCCLTACTREDGHKSRMASLESKMFDMQYKISSMKLDLLTKVEHEEAAVVDPVSKGYSVARNEFGAFPVIVEDAQPFLDGHKVRFRIGNLTSATMTDVSLILTYGVRDPEFPSTSMSEQERSKAIEKYLDAIEENKKGRKTITVDSIQDLAAAGWSHVEVVISPSTPEELGKIEVRIRVKGLRLADKG